MLWYGDAESSNSLADALKFAEVYYVGEPEQLILGTPRRFSDQLRTSELGSHAG